MTNHDVNKISKGVIWGLINYIPFVGVFIFIYKVVSEALGTTNAKKVTVFYVLYFLFLSYLTKTNVNSFAWVVAVLALVGMLVVYYIIVKYIGWRFLIGTLIIPFTLILITIAISISIVINERNSIPTEKFSIENHELPNEEAFLFVYRKNGFMGSGVTYNLKINDFSVGTLLPGKYAKFFIKPGTYEFSAFREIEVKLNQILEAKKVYYLEESWAFGDKDSRPQLKFVNEKKAYKELSKCTIVDNIK